MKKQMKKETKELTLRKASKVLLFNISLCMLILLTFKFILAGILTIILMPIFCKCYLNEELFVNIRPIDYFTSTIFVILCIPGCFFLLVLDMLFSNK